MKIYSANWFKSFLIEHDFEIKNGAVINTIGHITSNKKFKLIIGKEKVIKTLMRASEQLKTIIMK